MMEKLSQTSHYYDDNCEPSICTISRQWYDEAKALLAAYEDLGRTPAELAADLAELAKFKAGAPIIAKLLSELFGAYILADQIVIFTRTFCQHEKDAAEALHKDYAARVTAARAALEALPFEQKQVAKPKTIELTIEIPEMCGECKFYSESQYRCHNEQGNACNCAMGYMKGDMRDKSFINTKYPHCRLGEEHI